MTKVFYVSDYHFYHELSLKRSRSNEFGSVGEMNEEIVRRHNLKVGEDDHVYILGDVLVCSAENLRECLENTVMRLNGHLHLVAGNHDTSFLGNELFESCFETIDDTLYLEYSRYRVVLFHYPILFWYKKQRGAYHVYGHVHDERNGMELKVLIGEDKAFNACLEINGYEPCTLRELQENNIRYRKTFDN